MSTANKLKRLYRERASMIDALQHAENALRDYIPTLERSGASLNYGHSVLRRISAALKLAQESPTPKE